MSAATSRFIIQRNNEKFTCLGSELKASLRNTDTLYVQRNEELYSVTGLDLFGKDVGQIVGPMELTYEGGRIKATHPYNSEPLNINDGSKADIESKPQYYRHRWWALNNEWMGQEADGEDCGSYVDWFRYNGWQDDECYNVQQIVCQLVPNIEAIDDEENGLPEKGQYRDIFDPYNLQTITFKEDGTFTTQQGAPQWWGRHLDIMTTWSGDNPNTRIFACPEYCRIDKPTGYREVDDKVSSFVFKENIFGQLGEDNTTTTVVLKNLDNTEYGDSFGATFRLEYGAETVVIADVDPDNPYVQAYSAEWMLSGKIDDPDAPIWEIGNCDMYRLSDEAHLFLGQEPHYSDTDRFTVIDDAGFIRTVPGSEVKALMT